MKSRVRQKMKIYVGELLNWRVQKLILHPEEVGGYWVTGQACLLRVLWSVCEFGIRHVRG